jgi:hypothetical protein
MTLAQLKSLIAAATHPHYHVPDSISDGAFYEPCDSCYANQELRAAANPTYLAKLVACIEAADAMRGPALVGNRDRVAEYDAARAALDEE